MTEEKNGTAASGQEATSLQAEAAPGGAKPKKAKMRKKKKLTIAGVVVGVVIVACVGFGVWHETPGFCGAICHTPMDPYLATYETGTHDKLGNELTPTEASSMLSYKHKPYMGGMRCMDCHKPVIGQQVSEGTNWITGNYAVAGTNALGQTYLESRSLADLSEGIGVKEDEFCLNSGCHVATPDRKALFEKTKYLESEYNPHSQRHGDIDCSQCHKAHTQSVNYCTECHATAPVPDGWLTMDEAREKGVVTTPSK
ncbi:MAG: cytochrome c3 family protein [Coriobacteriales bacterium]|nr:cytochrome c3 family protein [Coriobacteriales bacterium]